MFLGIAAHDLRNPIGNIQMADDLLITADMRLPEEDKLQMLVDMRQQTQFMLNLLHDLLDISQIDVESKPEQGARFWFTLDDAPQPS